MTKKLSATAPPLRGNGVGVLGSSGGYGGKRPSSRGDDSSDEDM
jgi:hypothetical protein